MTASPTRLFAALLVSVFSFGCASDGAPTSPSTGSWYFPAADASWERVRPADAGFDSTLLSAALDWAGDQNSSAVVVVWRGRIVMERYWDGWTTLTRGPYFSAGKTITAALTLDLVHDGDVSLDAPVSTYLGEDWSRNTEDESDITLRKLLAMSSGTNDSLQRVYAPTAARFYYNNPAYYQLFGVIEAATGQTMAAATTARLFTPIGMSRTLLLANEDTGEPGYIFFGSARDFARFGMLTLNHGRWNGTQVLADSALLHQARTPSGTDNLSYGWMWWLNGGASHRTPGPYLLPTNDGPIWSAAPADLAAALGLDDKKLYVVPSLDLVIVRLGARAPISGEASPAAVSLFDNAFWTQLMAARTP